MSAPMPTMQEIDYEKDHVETHRTFASVETQFYLRILEAARRGVEASVCPDCKNTFLQPFKCVTCGAQKLYDSTLLAAQQRAEQLEAELAALKAAQPQETDHEGRPMTYWGGKEQPERVSVPREPTPEMLDAICSVRFKQGAEMYREIYKTMIAAAQEGK